MSTRPTPFGADSVRWALPHEGMRVLALGRLGGLAEFASAAGCLVTALEGTAAEAQRMAGRVNGGAVRASDEDLPFAPHTFDRVLIGEGFAAGRSRARALPEIARVLRAGGRVVLALNSRDDTVPWVKRLARLVQQLDSTAMRGDYGTDAIEAIERSEHFAPAEHRTWRNWVPIDRRGLLDMVASRPTVQRQPEAERDRVLGEIAALYDSSARVPDPLLLPFQTVAWAATVDHSRLDLSHVTESVQIRIDH